VCGADGEENGEEGERGRRPAAFESARSAGQQGKRRGGGQLSATWGRRRGVGHGTMVSSAERPAAAPNRRALAVALW
jgi:hypothetical protein